MDAKLKNTVMIVKLVFFFRQMLKPNLKIAPVFKGKKKFVKVLAIAV